MMPLGWTTTIATTGTGGTGFHNQLAVTALPFANSGIAGLVIDPATGYLYIASTSMVGIFVICM